MILLFQISGVSWFMDLLFVLVSVSVDSLISPCLGAGSQFSSLVSLANRWWVGISGVSSSWWSLWFGVSRVPERLWPHEIHHQGHHHPQSSEHHERAISALGILRTGKSILKALGVCTVALTLPEKWEEATHRHLVAEDTFTRIEVPSVGHF